MNTAAKLVIGNWKMNGSAALLRAFARGPFEMLAFHAGLSAAAVRIVYGGSVGPRNAGAILARRQVAGVLVGGASLRPADFAEICKAASRCSNETGAEPEAAVAALADARHGTRTSEGGMARMVAASPRHPAYEGDDDVHPGR